MCKVKLDGGLSLMIVTALFRHVGCPSGYVDLSAVASIRWSLPIMFND